MDLIQDFHDQDFDAPVRRSILDTPHGVILFYLKFLPPIFYNASTGDRKRRQQIIGEAYEPVNENSDTRVYVSKSEATRYFLMTVLKSHFLFSQLRDFELDDVIDEMQAIIESKMLLQRLQPLIIARNS